MRGYIPGFVVVVVVVVIFLYVLLSFLKSVILRLLEINLSLLPSGFHRQLPVGLVTPTLIDIDLSAFDIIALELTQVLCRECKVHYHKDELVGIFGTIYMQITCAARHE